jgi:hypothetical protein
MNVLIIDNHFEDGDHVHLFIRHEGVWVAMFNPLLTLVEFLEERLEELPSDEFDIPEQGGWDALERAAVAADAGEFFGMLDRWQNYRGRATQFGDWEVSYEELDAHHFSPEELRIMLTALRIYGSGVALDKDCPKKLLRAIDALHEKLNCPCKKQ